MAEPSRTDVARAVFEDAWNRRDFTTTAAALQSFRLHIGAQTRESDAAELRDFVDRWHAGFPDFRFELHAVVASGDHVAVRATLRGTHEGGFQGRAPTGRTIAVPHMFFLRFDGERIAEVWELLDADTLREQLDAEPGDG
ncbi:ester cyclase [Microbacter sp. GSS18]|nr:ester cyclase [Microbacter sp. GSS18]